MISLNSSGIESASAAQKRIEALRSVYGHFSYVEWPVCAQHLGIQIYCTTRQFCGAFLLDRIMLIPSNVPPSVIALYAWHELGHAILHIGNREYIRKMLVGGEHILRRFERQAWEFALIFPVWDSDALEAAITEIAAQGSVPDGLAAALAAACDVPPWLVEMVAREPRGSH